MYLLEFGGYPSVNQLIAYILKNIQLDISGDLSMEQVRQFLREDDTRESRKLLGKLLEEQSINGMLITVAECLQYQHLRSGVDERAVHEQLRMYSDS